MDQIFNRVQFTLFLPDLQNFFFENNPHVVYFPDILRPNTFIICLSELRAPILSEITIFFTKFKLI